MKFYFLFFLFFGKIVMLSNVVSSDDEDSDSGYDSRIYSSSAPTVSRSFHRQYLPNKKRTIPIDIPPKVSAPKGLTSQIPASKYLCAEDDLRARMVGSSDDDVEDFNTRDLEDLTPDSSDNSDDDSRSNCSTSSTCTSVSTNSYGERIRLPRKESTPGLLCRRIFEKQAAEKRQALKDVPLEAMSFFSKKINVLDKAAQDQAAAISVLYNTVSPTESVKFLRKKVKAFYQTVADEDGIEESIFKDVVDYYVEMQLKQANKTMKTLFKREKEKKVSKLKNWIEYEKNATETLHQLCELLNDDPYRYTEYTKAHQELIFEYVKIHCDHLVFLYQNRGVISAATEGTRGSNTKLALENFQKNIPIKLNRIFGGGKRKKYFAKTLKPLFDQAIEEMNNSQTVASQTIASVCSSVSGGMATLGSYVPSIFGGTAPKPIVAPPAKKEGWW